MFWLVFLFYLQIFITKYCFINKIIKKFAVVLEIKYVLTKIICEICRNKQKIFLQTNPSASNINKYNVQGCHFTWKPEKTFKNLELDN